MNNQYLSLASLIFFCWGASGQQSPSLIRGPYLQIGTPTSIMVLWRTDIPSQAVVRYGTTPELGLAITNFVRSTNCLVSLTNLRPDTIYHYAIGTPTQHLAGGSTYFFKTAPVGPKPTRIWAIGDCGTASLRPDNYHSRVVRDAYYNFTGDRYTDVWLMLGDNAYSYGEDHEYQAAVFEVYNPLLRQTTLWSTIGNHETWSSAPIPPYFNIFTFPTIGQAGGVSSGTENYYSFEYGDIHFVCLDSEISDQSPASTMADWLEEDLMLNDKKWLIAFWHTPPYSKGSNPSDSPDNHMLMRENFVSILERYGVDIVLNGHSHSYERSFLLDRHYGISTTIAASNWVDKSTGRRHENGAYLKPGRGPHEGALYIVAGSSAWTGGGSLNHPAMCVSLDMLGSLVLDIDDNELDGTFLGHEGQILDRFAITKGIDPEPVLWLSQVWLNRTNVVLRWRSEPGKDYVVEHALDPAQTSWAQVAVISAAGPFTTWTNVISAEAAFKSFYRVHLD